MAREKLEIGDLLRIPFLAGLQPGELEALLRAARTVSFGEGEVIFQAGQAGTELFVLVEGEVAIELEAAGAPPRVIATLNPGTVFGEVAFLLAEERTATARSLRPTRLLAFTREALERGSVEGRQAVSALIETIARILALRLQNVDRELADTCARIRAEHPAASKLLDALEERRRRVQHGVSF